MRLSPCRRVQKAMIDVCPAIAVELVPVLPGLYRRAPVARPPDGGAP